MSFTRPLSLSLSLRALRPSPSLLVRPTLLPRPTVLPSQRSFSALSVRYEQQRHSAVSGDPKWKSGKPVTYEEVKAISQAPDDNILIIDVREPSEVALGSIPSSVNLPLSEFEKAIRMDEGDFVKTYGFRKPTKQQGLITLCKAGIRAQTALDLAKSAGYKWTRNYEGSYNDWEKREKANPNNDD
ncbi:hypothetical protein JCM6882_003230 [Rhodosporidiobolus microsporus]